MSANGLPKAFERTRSELRIQVGAHVRVGGATARQVDPVELAGIEIGGIGGRRFGHERRADPEVVEELALEGRRRCRPGPGRQPSARRGSGWWCRSRPAGRPRRAAPSPGADRTRTTGRRHSRSGWRTACTGWRRPNRAGRTTRSACSRSMPIASARRTRSSPNGSGAAETHVERLQAGPGQELQADVIADRRHVRRRDVVDAVDGRTLELAGALAPIARPSARSPARSWPAHPSTCRSGRD